MIPPQWDQALEFSGGMAPVRTPDDEKSGALGTWGVIDTRGKYVLEPQFDSASVFQGALAYTETAEGKMGYIDRTGKSIWTEP